MHSSLLIRGALVLDPAGNSASVRDVFVAGTMIRNPPAQLPPACTVIDGSGLRLVPGLTDLHVHFREPGNEAAETLASGAAAAAAGGFTRVLTMPNTTPRVDTPERVRWQLQHAGREVVALCAGAVTADLAGKSLSDMPGMASAGAAAFTDDGVNIGKPELLEAAMRIAARLDRPILDHALDHALATDGTMRSCRKSEQAGLKGIPAEAETAAVARDIKFAEKTGCRIHIQHVSTAGAIELIAEARARGLRVSGEATPHHLLLSTEELDPSDPSFKMSPPLGTPEDRAALAAAVANGVLTALATDHAPHTAESKARGFASAPFGVIGLETAVAATHEALVRSGLMDELAWAGAWTTGPAAVLGIEQSSMAPGRPATLALLDLSSDWVVEPATFRTLSRNTPFAGRTMKGRALLTMLDGRITWDALPDSRRVRTG
ncbi:MAG: dihydroorotase [Lentisphaerae bacterium]|nr:dihydroorotase [Lentisphaerota bacterium]